jgi:hypothetical protein
MFTNYINRKDQIGTGAKIFFLTRIFGTRILGELHELIDGAAENS